MRINRLRYGSIIVAVIIAVALIAAWWPPQRGVAGTSGNVMTASRFSITVDGYEIGMFSKLKGIETGIDPIALDLLQSDGSYRFAGLPETVKPGSLVLKRRQNRNLAAWSWHRAALSGDSSERRGAVLTAFNNLGKPIARYHLENAWPSKIEITTKASGVLMEQVTIVYESLQRVSP